MHEWALAEAVVLTALQEQKKRKIKKIKKIKVRIGELQQIDRAAFSFALKEVLKLKKVQAEIRVREEKARLSCWACGQEWPWSESLKQLSSTEKELIHFLPEVAHLYFNCPACQKSDFQIVQGRGIGLAGLE